MDTEPFFQNQSTFIDFQKMGGEASLPHRLLHLER